MSRSLSVTAMAPVVSTSPRTATSCASPPSLHDYSIRQVSRQLGSIPSEDRGERDRRAADFLLFTAVPGGMVSAIIHLLLLISLGVYILGRPKLAADSISIVVVDAEDDLPDETELEEFVVEIEPPDETVVAEAGLDQPMWDAEVFDSSEDLAPDDLGKLLALADRADNLARSSSAGGGGSGLGFVGDRTAGGGLAGRGRRRQQALARGATIDSENAVDLALRWIVRHQRRDGSWCFQHRTGDHQCIGCLCGNPGGHSAATRGATGMALLALLGAGNSHWHGQYRGEIARGLEYLIEHQATDGGFFEPGGRMYSHGLATLALCEALAMTRYEYQTTHVASVSGEAGTGRPSSFAGRIAADQLDTPHQDGSDVSVSDLERFALVEQPAARVTGQLQRAAQRAVTYTEQAQHLRGGWRYHPRQKGDTSVVGWQMMALKSAELAGLDLDPNVPERAKRFLSSVSEDRIGSCYGYMDGNARPYLEMTHSIGATTPIGLLCRMYTGWDRSRRGLRVGVERIGLRARSGQGMYFYYYASQVMHHYGGTPWEEWNQWMREYLVRTQSGKGSEAGSWIFRGSHDDAGRLYCTAMAAMTLEVYYRYSPIYGTEAVADSTDGSTHWTRP